jgi:threonine/homoserine/homoserine lactone efflux protein
VESVFLLIQKAYITGWIVAAPIGPVNLEIIRRSLVHRLRAGLFVGLGAVTVDVCYMSIFSIGLGAFLQIPVVHVVLFLTGGAFLAFLGLIAMRDGRAFLRGRKTVDTTAGQGERARSALGDYGVGLLMTAMNPMTIGFWSALSLEFAGLPVSQRLVSTAALFAGCFSWVLALILVLKYARKLIGPRMFGIVTIAGGVFLLYFGLRFIAEGAGLDVALSRLYTGALQP